ncbi:MAG: hypothetical protein FDZ70_06035 [Actinobacteria bacterium]|nr:MAG: hypothetical protein FDZ70_06035 [Actinomycetota bacterium]
MARNGRCVAIALAAVALAAAGCLSRTEAPAPTMSADDPAAKPTCCANQVAAMSEVFRWTEGGGRPVAGITPEWMYKQGILSRPLVCPAGGTFIYVPTEWGFECSIHGMAPNE